MCFYKIVPIIDGKGLANESSKLEFKKKEDKLVKQAFSIGY